MFTYSGHSSVCFTSFSLFTAMPYQNETNRFLVGLCWTPARLNKKFMDLSGG